MTDFLVRLKHLGLRGEEGSAAIEAAFILPLLFMFVFGIIEFGIALWQWNTMLLAVEQAGRYAMVNNNSTSFPACTITSPTLAGCAQQQMTNMLSGSSVCTSPSAGKICVNASRNATSPPTMTLTANYSFTFFGLVSPFTIASTNTVPLD